MDEYLLAIRALWADEVSSFEGDTIAFDHALFSPRNESLSPIPILIGGSGRVALARAARVADGWHAFHPTVDTLKDGIRVIRSLTDREVKVSTRMPIKYGSAAGPDLDESTSLVGDWAQMLEKIEALHTIGVGHIVLDLSGSELPAYLDEMDWIAAEILRSLRQ